MHKLGGSWLEHPFWRGTFLLERAEDWLAIRDGAIPEVWIDLSRGLDVEIAAATARISRSDSVSAAAAPAKSLIDARDAVVSPAQPRFSIADEMERAQRVCQDARRAVKTIFHDARLGRTVDAEASISLVDEIAQSVSRNPDALVSMARMRARDDYTYMHSVAVCALMVALASSWDCPKGWFVKPAWAG